MRILLGHNFREQSAFGTAWIEAWLDRLRRRGFDVHPFSLVFDQTRPISYFPELDMLWRLRDRRLMAMYERLAEMLAEYDVFIVFNGANIHPDFLRHLNCFCVYGCFDDPESSNKLSRPVAGAFDLALVGNIAELDLYRSWGVKNVHWWPLGFRQDDFDPALTEQMILEGRRDVDVMMMCERETQYRKARLQAFTDAFPDGAYYGKGWPAGFLPEADRIPLMHRSKIGINIHNSTGPINFRTFYLPANGVLQICDNKQHFGKIFELGKEAAGYDTIHEAAELTRYYLAHDVERRAIAAAGWRRAIRDYNEVACFQRAVDSIQETMQIAVARNVTADPIELRVRETPVRKINDLLLALWMRWRQLRSRFGQAIRKLR